MGSAMTPNIELFQSRLRESRKATGLSLEQVAESAGMSKSYVWELERGAVSNPTVRAVFSLAGALGVTPAYLIGLDDRKSELDPLALKIAALIKSELAGREAA